MWTDLLKTGVRLNRRPYFFRGLALAAVVKLMLDVPKAYSIDLPVPAMLAAALVALAAVVVTLLQIIKRLHDLDLSGWFALLALIPIVNFVFGLYLLFKKGTDGPNRFGDDPLAAPEAPAPAASTS